MNKLKLAVMAAALLTFSTQTEAKDWTLQECISYALQNNISIQKSHLEQLSAKEDVLESRSQLLPSLSASTGHTVSYTPWVMSGVVSSDGYSRASIDKVSYNGNYSISGNYTIWNGNRNRNTLKLNKLIVDKASIDSMTTAQNIQEQIAQLFTQILYSQEAVEVNKKNYQNSQDNEARGKEIFNNGKLSRAELAQLEAQTAQDHYNVINAESNVRNYKRQLKQLLQLSTDEPFNVVSSTISDDLALQEIPAMNGVYASALDSRPEIKSYQNAIEQSELNIKIARASNLPTVSANAGASTSTTTMNKEGWGHQLKTNFNLGGGVTVSIPIFDNRSKKTATNKAIIAREQSMLDLKNEQTTLYSTIENYWIQAVNNQNQFKAAKVSTSSAQESYNLLSEQFSLGLKNIQELRTGKDNLLTAQQNELQSKYLTIYNIAMLNFYKDGTIK